MSAVASESSRTASYVHLLRTNERFRYLWYGQIVSLLGDWFNLIASASLVGELTGTGLAVGGLFVVRMLAPFLISPLAGVLADRYNRKWLLILTDLLRAVVVLGFLLVRTPGHVWLLYTLTATQLAISGIFFPTRTAILPDIVSSHELGAANAITSATWSIMLALGAALGGLVAGGWGIYPAFFIDALTFLLSAFFLTRIRYTPRSHPEEAKVGMRATFQQYVAGLRYFKTHPDILAIALHKAAFSLFSGGAFQVIQVALAERVFVIGEGGGIGLGILYAVVGVGTGVGPIISRAFTGDRDRPLRIALAISYPLASLGALITASLVSFEVVVLGTILRAVGGGINWVFSNQLLLQNVPDEVRGRVFAAEFAFFTLASALGALSGGWALDHPQIGIRGSLLLMAGVTLTPGVLWFLWDKVRLRSHVSDSSLTEPQS
ncbi:MAG: MFS transporter [Anaerolineales bacterium]|nr:MFS transporter [Anaerolineales bacterium]